MMFWSKTALTGNHPLILADLKAGTGREVLEWFLDVPFEELRDSQVTFVCLGSITSSPDSVQSFLNWVGELRDQVSYLVFKNLKDGEILPDYEDTQEASSESNSTLPMSPSRGSTRSIRPSSSG